MVHGRFEPSAAEQLLALRRSRDRYAALAEQLHDHTDPDLDPAETEARERDARRIAHAYEKSISNSVLRMTNAGQTHRFAMLSLGMRTWLTIFVAITGLEAGILIAHFQPQLLASAMKMERALNRAPAAEAPLAAPPATPPAQLQSATPQSVTPPAAPPQSAPAQKDVAPPPVKAVTAPTQTPTPATPTPAPSATAPPAPSVPTPSARPTSGPLITSAPPAPVTQPPAPAAPVAQPPPPVATAAPAPSPPAPSPPAPSPPAPAPAAAAPAAPAPAAAPVLTRPEAIAGTHTLPPYPNEAKRMGESGSTRMRVAISIQGMVTECTVIGSSGSERLDAAACHHVALRWRWKPATRDGQPVAATSAVTVVWSLQSLK
jgi:protein TonB